MPLSTLGFHLDGRICRVGCSFCYLGARKSPETGERALSPELLRDIAFAVPAKEIAVAVSEPAKRWRPGIEALSAAAKARGASLSITTTPEVVAADPWVLEGASRVSLSIDPEKGGGFERALACLESSAAGIEVVALVSLSSPGFADELAGGLLARLLDDPRFHHVALNGLKPPPPWCDRAFWLRFCMRIRPLLDRFLHARLHLDCYVGARILGLGGCPAKPDVSPGREFRACVYAAAPDFVFADAADLAARTAGYRPPEVCPFAIR